MSEDNENTEHEVLPYPGLRGAATPGRKTAKMSTGVSRRCVPDSRC